MMKWCGNGATAVYLDAEDAAQSLGTECFVQSVSAIFGFTNANNFGDLILHVSNVQQPSYGVLSGCDKSVGIFVQTNCLCLVIDSHVHNNSGAIIMMADSPSTSSTAGKPKIKQRRKSPRGTKKRKDDKKKQAEFLACICLLRNVPASSGFP